MDALTQSTSKQRLIRLVWDYKIDTRHSPFFIHNLYLGTELILKHTISLSDHQNGFVFVLLLLPYRECIFLVVFFWYCIY